MTGGLKLFHDKFAKNAGEFAEYAAQFDEAVRHNEQLRTCISKVGRERRPGPALRLFQPAAAAPWGQPCPMPDESWP